MREVHISKEKFMYISNNLTVILQMLLRRDSLDLHNSTISRQLVSEGLRKSDRTETIHSILEWNLITQAACLMESQTPRSGT